jgi:glutamine cyclotransferase
MPRWPACLLALALLAGATAAHAAIPVYGYKVVHVYPHDTGAYTEGLFYKDGYLYESTGEAGSSTVRKVELESGETVQRHNLPARYFGEGIIDWKGRLVQLTWQSQTGFVYDLASFTLQHTFGYTGEGWALTRDDKHLYMSDGTPVLRVPGDAVEHVVARVRQLAVVEQAGEVDPADDVAAGRVDPRDAVGQPHVCVDLAVDPLQLVEVVDRRAFGSDRDAADHLQRFRIQHAQCR